MGFPIRRLFAVAFAGLPLLATTVSWDLPSGSVNNTNYGNVYTSQTVNGAYLVARAYAVTGGIANTLIESAAVRVWSSGLGICNRDEPCTDPQHQVDNYGETEFLILSFYLTGGAPIAVSDIRVVVDPYGTYDTDVRYNFWTSSSAPSVLGSTFLPAGFGPENALAGPTTSSAVTHDLGGAGVYHLLFRAGQVDQSWDKFKIKSLSICYGNDCGGGGQETPEPGTYGLMAAGLLAIGAIRRRRHT